MPGISQKEASAYLNGRAKFLEVQDVEQGLGPAYNGISCGSCHNQPTIGGVGNVAVLRAGVVRNGRYEAPFGGDLVHLFSVGDHACQPQIPSNANNLAHRISTPLYGAGLIDAIPDSVIRTWEDPTDKNGDGIRGRAALVMDPVSHTMRVGRFGWKAQQATLLAFAGEAFRNEMGITNDLFPDEVGTGLSVEQLAECDMVADESKNAIAGDRSRQPNHSRPGGERKQWPTDEHGSDVLSGIGVHLSLSVSQVFRNGTSRGIRRAFNSASCWMV